VIESAGTARRTWRASLDIPKTERESNAQARQSTAQGIAACRHKRDDHRGPVGHYVVRREFWPRLAERPNRWVVNRGKQRVGGDGLIQLCDRHAIELMAEPFKP
jgi:hypothetical protein